MGASRDELWFKTFYQENSVAILKYFLRRTPSADMAADAVSETFLVAWRRIDEIPAGSESKLWLYGVARKVISNQRRGNVRKDRLEQRLRDDLAVNVAVSLETQTEDQMIIHKALSTLDDKDREILMLSNWEGLKGYEIASILELNAVAVRSRLHRARRRLGQEIEKMGFVMQRSSSEGHGKSKASKSELGEKQNGK